ncbi:FtsX-like permease family protein [Phycisphaerales bacterium AB-hyl4]|uniref:FtsX-like permease family protein n=1 Tax=Natronomicrosphaera hydrolytica TaxID=3242702 RepID=A0ABV4UCQ3_9BACT
MLLAWLLVALLPVAGVHADQFQADLEALTQHPHRLSGTEEGRAAATYIEQRLAQIGIEQVLPLEMPVWQTQVEHCELIVGGQRVPLSPIRPNIIANPVTPAEGLSGRVMYVGDGEIGSYGTRSPDGAIVVLDYGSHDNWAVAFALGAQAVIFLDHGDGATPIQPKHTGLPANFVRLYAHVDDLAEVGIDLTADHDEAVVHSHVTWQRQLGRNIIARIPGTDPGFIAGRNDDEAIVLAVHYDSFGVVPTRSPAARSAANIAALLEAAEGLVNDPPRRDVILMFLDNQARYHQGAREVYTALTITDREHTNLNQQHLDEQRFVRAMASRLDEEGLQFTPTGSEGHRLSQALQDEANFARVDIVHELRQLRLKARPMQAELEAMGVDPETDEPVDNPRAQALLDQVQPLLEQVEQLHVASLRWDEIRRALHRNALAAFAADQQAYAAGRFESDEAQRWNTEQRQHAQAEAQLFVEIFDRLQARASGRFERRLTELVTLIRIDEQRDAIRSALADPWIVAHVSYDLADGSGVWGPVVGDWTTRLHRHTAPSASADNPGYYGRVLAALRDARDRLDQPIAVDDRLMRDPTLGMSFAPRPFVHSGAIAGIHRIYNFSMMTGHDGRLRDGHPADTVDALDWARLRGQATEATALLHAAANREAISLSRVFRSEYRLKLPGWSNGRPTGDYARLQVVGGLAEDRPASGAMLAIWPSAAATGAASWTSMAEAMAVPSFEPVMYEATDENGRFRLVTARNDQFTSLLALGATFDEQGKMRAVSSMASLLQDASATMQVTMFLGRGYAISEFGGFRIRPQQLHVLKASTDAALRDIQSLWGQLAPHTFFFVADQEFDDRIKLFQPLGPVVLGIDDDNDSGVGLSASGFFQRPVWLSPRRTTDLEMLNEYRLRQLRDRGVTQADLESLQAAGTRARDRAEQAESVREREAAHQQAAALFQKVYTPLRQAMDDLVHAIVMLLLLAIPFAFAMERLLVCATSVYGRISGFTVIFLVTFGMLYFMHPGFAIAATPVIIFLAFAIILLSSIVIYILVRKFRLELKAIQGHRVGLHDVEVSRMGTMLAAVGMGMSTMRRRPTRTFLTAVTVVMLTFTILGFASFSRTVGVRTVYQGPVGETMPAGVLMRHLDYSELPRGTLRLMAGQTGETGYAAGHWWRMRSDGSGATLQIARPRDGEALSLSAIMGLSLEELDRWPALAAVFGDDADMDEVKSNLANGGVYLPRVYEELLDLEVGDTVLVDGERVRFAGAFQGATLQRLRHLDGHSVLPVDFQDTAAAMGAEEAEEEELIMADEVDRDFVHLSADQVAIAADRTVRRMGGELHMVTLYPDEQDDTLAKGRELAQMLVMPVWAAGPDGVERMILTVLTEVTGGIALLVPVLLGGLIIFGTLLGSISDREKEIYTFSALGLSPQHVGVLFFAEAAVYAVVGGMGGQLLAQVVALVLGWLHNAGIITMTESINYSSTNAMFAIGVVMATVLISAIYPAMRASKSANPGLARAWRMPQPEGDHLHLVFPFTVSAYDITGVVSFLAEHFRRHDDAGLGSFAASNVSIGRDADGNLQLSAELALAPFDLGVTQHMKLAAKPSDIEGVDEVAIDADRLSGARGDWIRANRVFMADLRKQFLLWRTLSNEMIEQYRMQTMTALEDVDAEAVAQREEASSAGSQSGQGSPLM